jgi:hypothetical protein
MRFGGRWPMIKRVNYADIHVRCSQYDIQNIIQTVMYHEGYTMQWYSSVEGIASRGSKTGNFFLYPYVRYTEVVFQIYPMQDKSVIRVIKSFRGFFGGRRVFDYTAIEKGFIDIVNHITYFFQSRGLLESTLLH